MMIYGYDASQSSVQLDNNFDHKMDRFSNIDFDSFIIWWYNGFVIQRITNLGGVIMSTVSLRLNDKDDSLIRKYAELHNMDLSAFIRQAVIDKIEDEYDLTLFNKVWQNEKDQERISHTDLKKELGL